MTIVVAILPSTLRAEALDTRVRTRYMMGTECSITLSGDADWSLFDIAFEEIDRVESALSTWRTDTELARLNRSVTKDVHVSKELGQLLSTARFWITETNGAFNPLIGSLIDAWSSRHDGRRPSQKEIANALDRMRIDHFVIDPARQIVHRPPGVVIEEGGFGKGYALDLALARLGSENITEAFFDFGGQIAVRSESPVEVAIAHPERRAEPAVLIRVSSGSLATSSGSERTFEIGGTTFSHILDPRTGLPLPPRGSVSVFHQNAMVADILSTALYVMGPDEGLVWADQHHVAALFLISDSKQTGLYRIRPSGVWRSEYPATTVLNHKFVMEDEHNHAAASLDPFEPLNTDCTAVGTEHHDGSARKAGS